MRGGTNDEENLAWACNCCNQHKKLMTAEEFGDYRDIPMGDLNDPFSGRFDWMYRVKWEWQQRTEAEQPDWWRELNRRQADELAYRKQLRREALSRLRERYSSGY
jgi:hypothetical protein